MNRIIFASVFFFVLFSFNISIAADQGLHKTQSNAINNILKIEKNEQDLIALTDIINRIDTTYSDLYENLKNNKKLIIFFDPAHGKLPDGRWQGGAATKRQSCTGKPEEFYSIMLSRALYKLFSKNKHIEIKTTPDFLSVLKGENDIYNDIPFSTTVALSKEAGAFIIISEHLNNVSVIHKASGRSNLTGFHITRNEWGFKMLTYVTGSYSGFLTLYNKLDASGLSRTYALKLKEYLMSRGLKPNNWDFGAVGDSRFSYFVDFPVSVIYESGFISNPDEEKKLKDQEYVKKIAESQYDSLLDAIADTFGVDISGSSVKKLNDENPRDNIDSLKLARISVYYLRKGCTEKALNAIRIMQKNYSSPNHDGYIKYFSEIRPRLEKSETYYKTALKFKNKKQNKKARYYFSLARKSLSHNPVFSAYHKRYSVELKQRQANNDSNGYNGHIEKSHIFINPVVRAPLSQPVILTLDEGQTLEDAVRTALEPDKTSLKKITSSLKNAKFLIKKRILTYSSKKKKKIVVQKKEYKNASFTRGIYLVTLNKNLTVKNVCRVNKIPLNPGKYQNQLYLKNSYFATGEKNKAL